MTKRGWEAGLRGTMLASSELAIATMDFRGRPVVPAVPYSTGPYARPLEQALLEALRAGDPAEVSKLVEQGADPNARVDGKLGSLLHVACDIPDVDAALVTASLLLDHSADAERRRNDGATCLFMACARGHAQLSELLLSRGPAMAHMLREDGSSSVFAAARAGHADCCQLLLAGGASANLPRHDGATPLLIATISSQPQARHAHAMHVQRACSAPTVRMQCASLASLGSSSGCVACLEPGLTSLQPALALRRWSSCCAVCAPTRRRHMAGRTRWAGPTSAATTRARSCSSSCTWWPRRSSARPSSHCARCRPSGYG